jgi:hypothetical protein
MKLKQLAKHLDTRALMFARSGDLKKSFASMEVAAFIRRQSKAYQRMEISIDIFADDK